MAFKFYKIIVCQLFLVKMISSQSAIKQYVVTSPPQQSRAIDLQSLLSSCSALSPNIPPLSSLAITAISNGLQNVKMASSVPMTSSNMLSASLPAYSSSLLTLGQSLSQVPTNLPTVRPSVTQMGSRIPSMGPSLPQMTSNLPIARPSLSRMPSNLPTVGPNLGQIATNLPNVRPNLSPMSCSSPSSPSLTQMASNLPAFTPNLPPALSNFPIASPNCQTAGVDASVLNNLAIALQLLILSNILNASPEDSEHNSSPSKTELVESLPNLIKPTPAPYVPVNKKDNQYTNGLVQKTEDPLRHANFLGSSNFAENSMMLNSFGGNPVLQGCVTKVPNSRTGFTLMSPYEALGPNSDFSDPILSSPYALSSGRSEFISPYSSFESYSGFDSDLFSMTDIM